VISSKAHWLLGTLGYQVGNFLSTILLVAIINYRYGSALAAQISSIEIFTGVAGSALLRLALVLENTIDGAALLRVLNRIRLVVFLLGFAVCLVVSWAAMTKLGALISLAAICVTPAYELLKTDYKSYGALIFCFRLISALLLCICSMGELASVVYFLPLFFAGAAVFYSSQIRMLECCTEGRKSSSVDSHWIAVLLAVVTSTCVAYSSHKLIEQVATLQGLWVTFERVSRAGVAFLFPYIYRLVPNRRWLAACSLLSLMGCLVFIFFGFHEFGQVPWGFLVALLPSLLAFGSTWAGMDRVGSLNSMLTIGTLLLICWVLT
jgi:hypothetical protein